MKNYMYTIAFTLICFTHLYSEDVPKLPGGAEAFFNQVGKGKPWYQFIPSIGSVDVPKNKMASHRGKTKIEDITTRREWPNFDIIDSVPAEMFQKLKSPFFWGYAKNLNDRPFVAIAFKIKDLKTAGIMKDPSRWLTHNGSEIFSIAFTYGWTKDDMHPQGFYFWITTGGDGARYLGQYDVRKNDVTAQDMQNMANLIERGSVTVGGMDVDEPTLYTTYRLELPQVSEIMNLK